MAIIGVKFLQVVCTMSNVKEEINNISKSF